MSKSHDAYSAVLGQSECRQKMGSPIDVEMEWTYNDTDGVILVFYDGERIVGKRKFCGIVDAEEWFAGFCLLPVCHGRPTNDSADDGIAYFWFVPTTKSWYVQVGKSVDQKMEGIDPGQIIEAAEAAADTANAVRASIVPKFK